MKKQSKNNGRGVILIGCGNMGYSLLSGWLSGQRYSPADIHVIEPNVELNSRAAAAGVLTYSLVSDLPANLKPRLVVFAVKPQVMPQVLPAYKTFAPEAIFVSIAAGIKISAMIDALGSAPMVRAMPNTPTSIGRGSTVAYCTPLVSDDAFAEVEQLLKSGGAVHRVADEKLIDAATAISGSGPAYLFHFIEGLAEAGIRLGLPPDMALALARETVSGAGALAVWRDVDPAKLRQEVTSPNGTTAAALEVFMQDNALGSLIEKATAAAHQRAIELSRPAKPERK